MEEELQNIILVTTTEEEAIIIMSAFTEGTNNPVLKRRRNNNAYFEVDVIGSLNVLLCFTEDQSFNSFPAFIADFSPVATIFTGAISGFDDNMQPNGDIVVSTDIYLYDGETEPFTTLHFQVSKVLLNYAKKASNESKAINTIFGPIITPQNILISKDRNKLLNYIHEVPVGIDLEFELANLIRIATPNEIIIKYISNFPNSKKRSNDNNENLISTGKFIKQLIEKMNMSDQYFEEINKKFSSYFSIDQNTFDHNIVTDLPIQTKSDDKLGFSTYVDALHDFIISKDTSTPITISIDGPWGSGKSSLMQMLENSLHPTYKGIKKFQNWLTISKKWLFWLVNFLYGITFKILGKGILWTILKKDKYGSDYKPRNTETQDDMDFITEVANGLLLDPDLVNGNKRAYSDGIQWWASINQKCQPMEPKSNPTVWLNAWKFDNHEEVWAALALSTLEQIKKKHSYLWRIWLNIQLTIKRSSVEKAFFLILIRYFLPLSLLIISASYNILISSYDTLLDAFATYTYGFGNAILWIGTILSAIPNLLNIIKDPFQIETDKFINNPKYEDKISFLTHFEKDFATIVDLVTRNGLGWKKSKLVIFIDDLDRCKPPKAADIVEAINLFLDVQGCVFVIGMDSDSVVKSIEVKYKDLFEKMKAERNGEVSLGRSFLEKIIQIPFTLPRATNEQIKNMVLGTLDQNRITEIIIETPNLVQLETEQESEENPQRAVSEENQNHEELPIIQSENTFDPASLARTEIREAIKSGVELLNENPRQIKKFINLFRLNVYIANARGFIEGNQTEDETKLLGLNRLAYWTVASIRWPSLIRHLSVEFQSNELRNFIKLSSSSITDVFEWPDKNKIPDGIVTDIRKFQEKEKESPSHWSHLPWECWYLEKDFIRFIKLSIELWEPVSANQTDWLEELLTMTRVLNTDNTIENV